jgi:hypothetical protein
MKSPQAISTSWKASLFPAENDGKLKFLIFHKLIFRNGMNGEGTMEDISAVLVPQPPVLDVPELRRHLKQRLKTSPVLRPHLSNLEQMLKSWDGGGKPGLPAGLDRTDDPRNREGNRFRTSARGIREQGRRLFEPATRRITRLMEMMMAKFRKKPVVIEAIRVSMTLGIISEVPEWIKDAVRSQVLHEARDNGWTIKTLEGDMRADPGDWIIRGVKGELYPCKPDIFAATYDPA